MRIQPVVSICVLISTLMTSSYGQLKNPEAVKSPERASIKALSKEVDWAGIWKGKIAGQLEIIFHLQAPVKASDKWTGNFDVPMQKVKGFVLDHIEIKGDEIKFELGGVPGNAKYEGRITGNLQEIEGRFRQFVINQPMKLAKDSVKPIVFDANQINILAEKLLKDWNAPGLAIGIVKGGKLIHAAGYGYKNVEKKEKMTADTLLAIGSCTKAFTTATIAKLVEEGKLDWDRPVNQYLPAFRMVDPFTTQIVSLRDMVTHRTGLPRYDLIWFAGELSRAEILSRVPYLSASASLRQKWIYNNIMYTTAGAVAEFAGGKPWEQQVREAFLNPLEMKRTNFHINELQADPDHSTGYHKPGVAKETWLVKPYREIAGMAPAGSINSSVKEMSAWMNFQLGHGPKNSEGKTLLKETSIRELQSPQMIVAGGLPPAERTDIHSMGYAMGWSVESYRGHKHVHHGGAIDGFVAQVDLFPDDDLGIVALANQSGSALPSVICPTIADMMLKLDPVDWSGQVLAKVEAGKKIEASIKTEAGKSRVAGTKPSHELKDYVGVYHNAAFGRVEIKIEGDHLGLKYGRVQFPLEHWHYDVFNASKTKPEDDGFEDKKFQFQMDAKGVITSISADMEPMVPAVVFNRIAEARLSDPKFLASLTGEYELANQVMKIELEGNTLKAVLPGQPVYKLLPERGLTFLFDGLNGFKMEFEMDANGKPIGVSIEQPNGTFKAKKKLK